ncbi:hypothetical protein INR49_031060 [Caranx melampygus]|nr:hypothetical protein INR49_031060 [Caranx melampygus]
MQTLQIIPAEHRRKAHHDGHQPTQQHGRAGSPRGDQQAAVEVRLESDADGYGERDDKSPDRNVSQGQGDDETKRGVSQRPVDTNSPDHHHVPDDRGHGDHHLHPDVEGFRGRQTRMKVLPPPGSDLRLAAPTVIRLQLLCDFRHQQQQQQQQHRFHHS